jgi:hypothetical protein
VARGASPINVPAEKVVLHQHVLDTLLQWLLLLLCTGQTLSHKLGQPLELMGHFGGLPGPPPPNQTTPRTDRGAPRLPHPTQHTHTSLFTGSSQSWERLKAKQQRTLGGEGEAQITLGSSAHLLPPLPNPRLSRASQPGARLGPHRSSHLIWTQPGLRRKDQG